MPAANTFTAPASVAILGLGPSIDDYVMAARRAGARNRIADEVWAINALGDIVQADRIFHMDDVRIQEIRAKAAPDGNIAAMLEWLRRSPGPIYTSRLHPDYPGLVAYPLEAVLGTTPVPYLNSTAAYAVAYALHIGVKEIVLFGIDFTYPNQHDAERGRACVELWLGIAIARGVKVVATKSSTLLDANLDQAGRLYGYDTMQALISTGPDDRPQVSFVELDEWPTAEEIEHRYDHSLPINP